MGAESQAVRKFIELGEQLNQLRDAFEWKTENNVVPGNKKWGKYLKTAVPYLSKKRAKMAMELALNIDLNVFPTLAYISKSKLSTMISLFGGPLTCGRDDLDFSSNVTSNDQTEIKYIRKDIDELIKELKENRSHNKLLKIMQKRVRDWNNWFKKNTDSYSDNISIDRMILKNIKNTLNIMLNRIDKIININDG